jgi:hypothetical protein
MVANNNRHQNLTTAYAEVHLIEKRTSAICIMKIIYEKTLTFTYPAVYQLNANSSKHNPKQCLWPYP